MPLQQLHIITDEQHAEMISEILTEMGALAITFHDAADQAIFQLEPEKTSLWQRTRIAALFDNKIDVKKIFAKLAAKIPAQAILDHRIEILLDKVVHAGEN